MTRVYIILLAAAAFTISATGAIFSVTGLAQLFSGASLTVPFMAAALEFGKIVTAGFLYRYWGHIHSVMRTYLCISVLVLMGITSMGIYGYLSNAYQVSSLALKEYAAQKDALKNQDVAVQEEIKRIEKTVQEVPVSRLSYKLQLQKETEPELRRLVAKSQKIHDELNKIQLEVLTKQTKIGPITYVAEAVHADVDSVANFLILIFVSVFDPLAICLVIATNLAIRLKEKYRSNEAKIASKAFNSIVDHRYKKKKKPLPFLRAS